MKPFKGKVTTLSDVYMTILFPKALGELESFVLFKKPSKQYDQNAGLDTNKDCQMTKAEQLRRCGTDWKKGSTSHCAADAACSFTCPGKS